jgi:hypothetical protein
MEPQRTLAGLLTSRPGIDRCQLVTLHHAVLNTREQHSHRLSTFALLKGCFVYRRTMIVPPTMRPLAPANSRICLECAGLGWT